MEKKILFAMLLVIMTQVVLTQDKISTQATSIGSNLLKDVSGLLGSTGSPMASNIVSDSNEANVYFGTSQVIVENGDSKRTEFYGTFINDDSKCSHSRCFYGWIDNYTIVGEATVLGYYNKELTIKPVFQFKTNSEEDFIIVRDQNLDEIWVQMIEVLCEKINPQINTLNIASDRALASATEEKFESAAAQTPEDLSKAFPTEKEIQKPEEILHPAYAFKTVDASDLIGIKNFNLKSASSNIGLLALSDLEIGDKLSKTSQNILLNEFKAPISLLKETIVLNKENMIKNRAFEYNVKLASTGNFTDKGIKVPDFSAQIQVNLKHAQKTKIPSSEKQIVKKLLNQDTRKPYDLKSIRERRAKLGEIMDPKFNVVVDQGPTFEDAEILEFPNEVYTGVNVADQFNGINSEINSQIVSSAARKLQTVQNFTVYNYRKTLFSQTIFGRTFMAAFDLECYMLVYSNDQKVQCVGAFVYELFGNQRTVPIFNFIRSVSYTWSWSNQYRGNWGFNVYVNLPRPLDWIGFTFRFNINYVIDVSINFAAGGTSPYQVNVNCLASTRVDTDSSAGVRVVGMEGGAFMSGTLVNAGTDPRMVLSYYFAQRLVNVNARWDFWINAFRYNWGFYYRTYSIWSGWSSRRVISQWTINGVYGRWVIVNRNWNIYI